MLKSNYFKIFMSLNKVNYGKELNLYGVPIIYKHKNAQLSIGDSCTIKSSFLSNLLGLYQRTIIIARSRQAQIHIGDNVGISGATIYARNKITIGDNTLIGGNTKILDNDFHPIAVNDRNNNDESKIKSKEIIIGKNCFVGCNSLILKGSKIGDGSVIGAGSVVCGEFPNNVIIAGNPARVIRTIDNYEKLKE